MKYYEDLIEQGATADFTLSAINSHKSSELYQEAVIAYDYFRKRNVTISKYQKILYNLFGEAELDTFSSNYKFCNAFFPIFVKQENAFLLGNGVTFNKTDTKKRFGDDEFDAKIFAAGENALWGGVSFCFFNYDHIEVFKITEFVPLFSVEDGALHAGIRFWQVAQDKPLRATLYEEDGFTEYIWTYGDSKILKPKRAYTQIVSHSVADGVEIRDGDNYPGFPIVPLWGNKEHQSELTGLREKIDGYDLIQSGFANDLDDASQIYWIVNNAGGMDEIDLKKFIDQIKRVKGAVVDDGAHAEAHTLNIPYQARQIGLAEIKDSLYRDAMAVDDEKITSGNITATAINAAYKNLNLKCDGYEYCVSACIKGLLKLVKIDDKPTYHRSQDTNQAEMTQVVLSAAQYLDDETILTLLPFISIDQVQDILKKRVKEEMERFNYEQSESGIGAGIGINVKKGNNADAVNEAVQS